MSKNINISTSIDYCFNIKDYHPEEILDYLTTLQNPCLLCNKYHPVKFHSYTDRKVRLNNNSLKSIDAVRIICPNNLELNKSSGQKLQYTMTILPAFLMPYSTVYVPALEKAVDQYCGTDAKNMTEAAMIMHCEDSKSFALYFKRLNKNISRWLVFLACLISDVSRVPQPDMDNTVSTKSTSGKWHKMQALLPDYFTVIQKNPHAPLINASDYFTCFHAKLVQNQMGMGP